MPNNRIYPGGAFIKFNAEESFTYKETYVYDFETRDLDFYVANLHLEPMEFIKLKQTEGRMRRILPHESIPATISNSIGVGEVVESTQVISLELPDITITSGWMEWVDNFILAKSYKIVDSINKILRKGCSIHHAYSKFGCAISAYVDSQKLSNYIKWRKNDIGLMRELPFEDRMKIMNLDLFDGYELSSFTYQMFDIQVIPNSYEYATYTIPYTLQFNNDAFRVDGSITIIVARVDRNDVPPIELRVGTSLKEIKLKEIEKLSDGIEQLLSVEPFGAVDDTCDTMRQRIAILQNEVDNGD